MMDMVAAQSTLTNGLSALRVMVGQNGETNGMNILIPMVMALSKGKHGGRASMVSGGTGPGVSTTTALDGFTSMVRVVVASTGTHTSSKTHGMRDSLTSGSIIALTTQSSSGRFLSHLRCLKIKA